MKVALLVIALSFCCSFAAATAATTRAVRLPATQQLPREQWGAPLVDVAGKDNIWTLKGKKQTVTLDASDLSVQIKAGAATWALMPSIAGDLHVRVQSKDRKLRLADAKRVDVEPYDTGYKTGVKLALSEWPEAPQLKLYLTLALEGADEDLVFDVVAVETDETKIRQLDWPGPTDPKAAGEGDYTLLPNHRGVLLPHDWPKAYFPIRSTDMGGNPKVTDTSEVQSNVIESWSMSWWGVQRGKSGMMTIIETPDDAAYQFDHPAGGPTIIGPRWRAQLGKLGYLRIGRFVFIENGGYVEMAKRYRQHAIDSGLFVSLKEKIARKPVVQKLIGTPLTRIGVLTNFKSDSLRWSTTQPERNYRMTTFDDRAKQIRAWKAKGVEKMHICLTGWPNQGYDRQHPDEIPPAPIAGGVEGMKRLADACHELGYLLSLHDQYRDYYTDAPSFDPQFAVHEEDESLPAVGFPGSRFGTWKDGTIPLMNNWDGGTMAYMNNRLMPGHLRKNYEWLFAHGLSGNANGKARGVDGIYLDVFGYVPPDEDFNPEHPTTRTDALNARRACYLWSREHIGFIGTEAGCDWTVPYADMTSPLRSNKGVPVPLFNLVYHDAIITPYQPSDLRGFLNAGLPQAFGAQEMSDEDLTRVRRMGKLHDRLALAEMTKHEFLDDKFRKERTTFSDGTTVTVDWDTNSVTIVPDVE